MDLEQDVLLRQVAKRLKLLNIWLGIMTFFALSGLVIAALVAVAALTFINRTSNKIDNLEKSVPNTTNITSDFCSQSQISQVIKDQTGLCKNSN